MEKFCLLTLAVLTALLILPSEAQTQSKFFAIGTDASLECTWNDLENPEDIQVVKWTFKGRRLREGKRYQYSSEGNTHNLLIKNIQKKDKGSYICSPKMRTDQLLGDGKFVVSVDKARLPEMPEPRDVRMTEGGTGNLNCNYHQAKERYGLKLFWTYNGEKIAEGDVVHSGTNANYRAYTDEEGRDWLALSNLDLEAAGAYKCNYKYPDKQIFSMKFNVLVKDLTGPADQIRNVTVNEDRYTQSLICDLSSLTNVLSYRWEKDGEVINNETDSSGKMILLEDDMVKTLEFDDLNSEEHSGAYRCVAELEYYETGLTFNFVVEESTKERDFAPWSQWSSCDNAGKKYRFRTCIADGCSDLYGFVYEVQTGYCDEDDEME